MRSLTIVLIFILVGATQAQTNERAVANLHLPDIRGRRFDLGQYKGKVVLINFWATWCPPCRTEIPELIKLQTQYRDAGLRIIGITYPPERLAAVQAFVRKQKINYRVVVGRKETKAKFTSSEVLPVTVVVDRDGVVRDVVEGIMYPDEFAEKVERLLSGTRPKSPGSP